MQSLIDLKDRILERLQEIWHKIRENDRFIELKERFLTLPQHYQTLIKVLCFLLVAWLIYSIPASYRNDSIEKEMAFEENRELTRDLLKAGRLAQSLKVPPPGPSGSALSSSVQSTIRGEQVLSEQIRPVQNKDSVAGKKVISQKLDQAGVQAKVVDLNLEQVVLIAEKLDSIKSSRLINFVAQASSKEDHLFDVEYEVASFSVPIKEEPVEALDKKSKKKKKKKKKGKK